MISCLAAPRTAPALTVFSLATAGAAWLVLLILGYTAASMAWGGRLAFRRSVGNSSPAASGMRFPAISALVPDYGTIVTLVLALVIAVPVSIGIALFLTDIAQRWLRGPTESPSNFGRLPSIIYGMWGLFVFAPFMAVNVEPWMTTISDPCP